MAEDFLLVILTFDATIRVSVPLILAALAGLVVEGVEDRAEEEWRVEI